jgi:hypothetical protein
MSRHIVVTEQMSDDMICPMITVSATWIKFRGLAARRPGLGDRGSATADRGSRLADRGSRIGDRGSGAPGFA